MASWTIVTVVDLTTDLPSRALISIGAMLGWPIVLVDYLQNRHVKVGPPPRTTSSEPPGVATDEQAASNW